MEIHMRYRLFWFPFYPHVWRNDPDLRRCSAAARGAWIDILCVAFECQERGVLATNGIAWTQEELAEAIGGDISLNLRCIEDLLRKGVVSRREDGAIFSRRMVEEERARQAKSEKCSDAGKRGGRPAKGSRKGDQKGRQREIQKVASHFGSSSGFDFQEEGGSGKKAGETPDGFAAFWGAYPKKAAKKDALKAWNKLAPSGDLQATMLAALEKQKQWKQWIRDDGQFIPYPATWLNGTRWEDQESPAMQLYSDHKGEKNGRTARHRYSGN
jgi:hypothetical protein